MTDLATKPAQTTHIFQEAGLGTTPFKVVGFEVMKYQACQGAPIQPGASCDFCGTPIMNVYWILGSAPEDQRFKVGCVCVEKTGDRGLINKVLRMERDRKRKARHEAERKRIGRLFGLLSLNTIQADLASRPHPLEWRAEQGDTESDWADWMARNSGNAGKIKIARHVEKRAKELGIELATVEPKSCAQYLGVE